MQGTLRESKIPPHAPLLAGGGLGGAGGRLASVGGFTFLLLPTPGVGFRGAGGGGFDPLRSIFLLQRYTNKLYPLYFVCWNQ